MLRLRFNQVFLGLMALAMLSAFVLPPDLGNRLRGFQAIFAPVSRPTRAVASSVHNRLVKNRDTRDVATVKEENAELRVQLMSLSGQLEELKRVANDLDRLGDVRLLCTRFKVLGDDPGARDSLIVSASAREGVRETQPVLCGQGLVGLIERVGPAGAQVRLITDRDFKVSGRFVRMPPRVKAEQTLATKIPLVRGTGNGMLEVQNIEIKETALAGGDQINEKVQVEDYVKLDDPAWPPNLAGKVLGQVESITRQSGAPQHALIRIKPLVDFSTLREVMVMNKLDVPAAGAAEAQTAAAAEKGKG